MADLGETFPTVVPCDDCVAPDVVENYLGFINITLDDMAAESVDTLSLLSSYEAIVASKLKDAPVDVVAQVDQQHARTRDVVTSFRDLQLSLLADTSYDLRQIAGLECGTCVECPRAERLIQVRNSIRRRIVAHGLPPIV